jgi:hypothetical protein
MPRSKPFFFFSSKSGLVSEATGIGAIPGDLGYGRESVDDDFICRLRALVSPGVSSGRGISQVAWDDVDGVVGSENKRRVDESGSEGAVEGRPGDLRLRRGVEVVGEVDIDNEAE